VTADGTLLAWGSRMGGMLGITRPQDVGSDFIQPTDALSPTRLSVPFAAADVSASWQHALAVTKDGDVYAWGDVEFGRLGIGEAPVLRIGTNAPRTMPVLLYPVRVPGLTAVKAVAAGREHSLALMADGTVRAWGRNKSGQLGDGTTVDRNAPVQVPGITSAVAVAAGRSISAALLADGTVLAWGDNSNDAMGRSAPPANPVPALVPNVAGATAIAAGDNHFLALTRAGTVFSWGYDQIGETGRNRVNSAVPTAIPRLANVVAVYAKFRRSFAVLADGSVKIWGSVPLFGRPVGDLDLSPVPIDLLLNPPPGR
jgi:alpha-tubulin suppressor-like RCC1 family protein